MKCAAAAGHLGFIRPGAATDILPDVPCKVKSAPDGAAALDRFFARLIRAESGNGVGRRERDGTRRVRNRGAVIVRMDSGGHSGRVGRIRLTVS